MVLGLASHLEEAEYPVSVTGRLGNYFEEIRLAEVVGTGAGDEDPAGAKHFEGAKVEFLVAAEGSIEVALGLSEGGRIKHDGVIAPAGGGIVLEQVKGVRLDPFDLLVAELGLVEGGVLIGDFQRGTGTIDANDVSTARGEMEGEAALVAKNVEGFAVGVPGGGSIVLALVEEGSGFLAFESLEVKLNLVHREDRGTVSAHQQARGARRQFFELADSRVHAFDDGSGAKAFAQLGDQRGANDFRIHGLGENLQGENVVIAIDDEAGKEISLAEDDAVGVGVVDDRLAIGDGIGDALAQQGRKVFDGVARNQANGDLGGIGIERAAENLAAMIGDDYQ